MSSTAETPSPAPAEDEGSLSGGPPLHMDLPPMTAMSGVPAASPAEWLTRAVDRATSALTGGPLAEPEQIGPYKIVSRLGHGGMGVVYKAEQEHPVRRTVALKILKTGMDTREVVARFEAERQALAMMSHPAVARVYEAGATHAGRPYFAMEYVPGVPLTRYCEENRLPLRKRLDLFVQVCRAVQHAHQKGIIHRDLKPSNILVTVVDGEAMPKVIDFGIAKATQAGPALTERSLHTHAGMLIGTPEYMSPEQAFSDGTDVDTRSDIYSLGVILYQLLTGSLPYDPRTLRHLTPESVAQMILDSEPLRPSVKLAKAAPAVEEERPALDRQAGQAGRAGLSGIDGRMLRRQVHGDLDWITLKAIDKDRSRRYESAFALAADVMRYLESAPVTARPPTLAYRTRKFVQRHRLAVSVGGIVAGALLVGLGLSVYGLVQARIDRARAQASQAVAEETSNFLDRIFSGANPSRRETDMTLRQLLDETAQRLSDGTLSAKPEVEAAARLMIGKTYTALHHRAEAKEQLEVALAKYRSVHGESHPKVADALQALGNLFEDQEDDETARGYLQAALAMRREHLGEQHADVAETLSVLGNLSAQKHRHDEAETYYRQAEGIYTKVLGPNHKQTLSIKHNLALVLNGRGKRVEAIEQLREILARKTATLTAEHVSVANTAWWLADLLRQEDETEEALTHARAALEVRARKLDPARVELAESLAQVVGLLRDRGEETAALAVLVEHYEAMRGNERSTPQSRRNVLQMIVDQLSAVGDAEGLAVWQPRLLQASVVADGQRLSDAKQRAEREPENAAAAAGYGAELARSGQFREALAQYTRATELKPADHWCWLHRAALLGYLGEVEEYRVCRATMLARFRDSTDRLVADRIGKAALLLPEMDSSADLAALVKRAREGAGDDLADWVHLLAGLAEYRAGNFDGCLEPLEAARKGRIHNSAQVSAQLVAAMAHHRMNNGAVALGELEGAKRRMLVELPGAASGDLGDGVENWLICQTLYREASKLIAPASGDGP